MAWTEAKYREVKAWADAHPEDKEAVHLVALYEHKHNPVAAGPHPSFEPLYRSPAEGVMVEPPPEDLRGKLATRAEEPVDRTPKLDRLAETVGAAALGADKTFGFGLAHRIATGPGGQSPEDLQALEAAHPVATGIGALAGGLAPQGLSARLFKGIGEAIPAAAGAIGKVARGIAQGAGTAGGTEFAGNVVQGKTGDQALVTDPTLAALMGLGFGTIGGAGEALSGGLRNQLTAGMKGPALVALDQAAAEGAPSLAQRIARGMGQERQGSAAAQPGGIRIPPSVRSNFDEASTGGGYALDRAVEKAAPGLASRASGRGAMLSDSWTKFRDAYDATPEGQVALHPANTAKALQDIIRLRSHETGSPGKTPFVDRQKFASALNDTFEVMSPSDAERSGRPFTVKTEDEATRLGFSIPKRPAWKPFGGPGPQEVQATAPGVSPTSGGHAPVALVERELTAAKLEDVRNTLDELANAGDPSLGPETYRKLSAAIRADRDRYPWPKSLGAEPTATLPDGTEVRGLSAVAHGYAEKLGGHKGDLRALGIQGDQGGPEAMVPAMRSAVAGYGSKGNRTADEALRRLAQESPELFRALKEARVTEAAQEMTNSGPSMSRTGLLRAAELRLDPLAQILAAQAGKLGAGASQAVPRKLTEAQRKAAHDYLIGIP